MVLTAESLTPQLHVGKKKWCVITGKERGERRQNITLRSQNTGAHITFSAPDSKPIFEGLFWGKNNVLADFKRQLN